MKTATVTLTVSVPETMDDVAQLAMYNGALESHVVKAATAAQMRSANAEAQAQIRYRVRQVQVFGRSDHKAQEEYGT